MKDQVTVTAQENRRCLAGFQALPDAADGARQLVEALQQSGQTIATAESCTGGLVAAAIVSVPGASLVFENGFITYSDGAKRRLLGVSEETLAVHTAVSRDTAAQMAAGCAKAGQADLSLAVTGLAGPGGGSKERPVGLVYVSSCYEGNVIVQEYHFSGSRGEVRAQAVSAALGLGLYQLGLYRQEQS